MEKTFINPKRKTLQAYIDKCLKEINRGCRVRLLKGISAPDWRKNKDSHGIYIYDGGSVPGAYTYTATTSALEIAWWVAPNKKRHVRIVAERVCTSNYNVPRLIYRGYSGWGAVYPERFVRKNKLIRQRNLRILNKRGIPGDDDRFTLLDFAISALSKEGVLICDRLDRPTVAQVVVSCPSTGHRHHIGVPPKFVNPKTKFYQQFESEAERVHAAIAWTFDLKPEEYKPILAS